MLLTVAGGLLLGLVVLEILGLSTDLEGTASAAWSAAYDLIFLLAACACLSRGRRSAAERSAWTLIGIGLLLSGLGYACDSITTLLHKTAPFPGPADALWLAFYPFVYAGLLRLVKVRTGQDSRVGGDAILGALALCSVAAAVLIPWIVSATGADVSTIVTNVVYPLADVHLLGFVVWTGMLGGHRLGRAWPVLMAAIAGSVVIDAIYLVQITSGSYAGGLLDLGWPAVAMGFAVASFPAGRPAGAPVPERPGLRLAIPVIASLLATALVIREAIASDPELILAAVTLVAAVGRSARVAISARRLEQAVESSAAQLGEAQRLANAGSFELDLTTGRIDWSDELWRIHGVPKDSLAMVARSALSLIHPDDRAGVLAATQACIAGGGDFVIAYRIVRPDGVVRRLEMRGTVSGTILHTSVQDVTEQRLIDDRLRQSEARHRLVFESAHEGIWILDAQRRTVALNPRMCELLGRPEEDVMGREPIEFTNARGREMILQSRGPSSGTGVGNFELEIERPDSASLWVAGSVSAFRDEWSSGYVVIANDITQRRVLETRLRRAAEEDSLTGLSNRSRFEAAVTDRAARGGAYAVALVDLDHIKLVNDSFGHAAGDELLCHVAGAMAGALREQDLLARFGGDEFAILLDDADHDAAATIERLLQAVRDARWRGSQHQTASAGIAVAPDGHSRGVVDMLKAADIALYEAKNAGRDRCVLYHGHDGGLAWVEEVRAAIDEERLVLYSQRIVPLRGGEPREELLVRMVGREGELLPPASFIPVAEQFGLIADLDLWVVGQALELARQGRAVEVNLSGASLGEPAIVACVTRAVAEGVDPALLVFEVTETAAVRNLDHARRCAEALTELGCGFALDDFGTGFGSLTYLRELPVTQIKIDIEFVRDLADDVDSQRIVRAIVGIAQSFGHETVAEGVEDLDAIELLTAMGVDFAQGYALHFPAPVVLGVVPAAG